MLALTHPEEVTKDLPTIMAAYEDINIAEVVHNAFTNLVIRVYMNTDVKGIELCCALKNIIEFAAEISAGLAYGDNIKAAL